MKETKLPKIDAIFRKQYTEKQYQKKILKKLFVPADKKFVESLFTTTTDPKKGHTLYELKAEAVPAAAQIKRLNGIAKQLKKQKGRFNLVSAIAALLCVTVLGLALTVFRNQIARAALTSALEGSFGAKAEMGTIDFNLLDAKFTVESLSVANKAEPMKNLFSVGKGELYFNLLELSRGKVVAKNLEITGITWNTARTTSGAFPPKKQKDFDKKEASRAKSTKPNPVSQAIQGEIGKLKAGVSVDSGISAIKDQMDPAKFLEKEKAALKSPAVVSNITASVPALNSKWQGKSAEVRTDIDKTMTDGKKVVALKAGDIKTVEEAQAAVKEINAALEATKKTIALAKDTASAVEADGKQVAQLAKDAEAALKADGARIKALADSVTSLDLDTGKELVGDIFDTFAMNTLGNYYPYAEKGLAMLKDLQSGAKQEKKPTLKEKSGAVRRLPGRTVVFGDDSMPSLFLENIALSASDAASGIKGGATVMNVTNDADRLGKPVSISLDAAQGKIAETVSGVIDLRTGAAELVNTKFTVSGFGLSLPAGSAAGMPTIKGALGATGSLVVSNDDTLRIGSVLLVSDAKATAAPFEPAFLSDAYRDVLASVTEIRVEAEAEVTASGGVKLDVSTDLDSVINKALKEQMAKQVARFKADIVKEGNAYLARQKEEYASEIARFGEISAKSKAALAEIQNYGKTLEAKKAEAEKRVVAIVAEKAAPVQKAAKQAEKTATDAVKKLF